jgi:hypothetical protein
MKVSDLGNRTSSTPAYGVFTTSKQDVQQGSINPKDKSYPVSQTLMGGPQYHNFPSPSEKAFYAKTKLEDVAMRSFGRYHD